MTQAPDQKTLDDHVSIAANPLIAGERDPWRLAGRPKTGDMTRWPGTVVNVAAA
jgi:hypothetical protein